MDDSQIRMTPGDILPESAGSESTAAGLPRDARDGTSTTARLQPGEAGRVLLEICGTSGRPSEAIVARGLVAAMAELEAMHGVAQDPFWHPEGDVLTHSLAAADVAASRCAAEGTADDRRVILVLAALLHDIGKPATSRAENGRITSRGHAEKGARIVLSMADRYGIALDVAEPVAALVESHMRHLSVDGAPSQRAVTRLRVRLGEGGTTLDEWAFLVRCDRAARGSASSDEGPHQGWLRHAP